MLNALGIAEGVKKKKKRKEENTGSQAEIGGKECSNGFWNRQVDLSSNELKMSKANLSTDT